jgi:hypothetical protein
MTIANELPRRGGAHTFEQLEAEVLGEQAANVSTLRGADMTAEKVPAPKPDDKSAEKTGK